MSTTVEKIVTVEVPLRTAYDQWTQFEDFPRFMGGITQVRQLGDDRMEWVAEIAGVKRRWEAKVLEQVPDRKVSWAATEGATNAGEVTFQEVGPGQTSVHLTLEYEPEGLVEKVGDKLNIVENQAEKDLERFKAFIESESYETGAWRGSVEGGTRTGGTPNLDDAASSRGDEGKAGVTGKAVAAGVGVAAAAAVAGVAAASAKSDKSEDVEETAPVAETATAQTPVPDGEPTIPARVVSFEEVSGPTEAERRQLDEDSDL